MNETLPHTITTERVDDVPLLLAQMEQLGIPTLLDAHFSPHGSHQGVSLGRIGVLSGGDSKLGSLGNRATIPHRGKRYLCPLEAIQLSRADLAAMLDTMLDTVSLDRVLIETSP